MTSTTCMQKQLIDANIWFLIFFSCTVRGNSDQQGRVYHVDELSDKHHRCLDERPIEKEGNHGIIPLC